MAPNKQQRRHRPRNTLKQKKRFPNVEIPPNESIPGIELVSSIAVRRCIPPEFKNKLYEDLGVVSMLPKLDITPDDLFTRPGITTGRGIKPFERFSKQDAFLRLLCLQQFCDETEPREVTLEEVGLLGGTRRRFVGFVVDQSAKKELHTESIDISRETGMGNQAASSRRKHISVAQIGVEACAVQFEGQLSTALDGLSSRQHARVRCPLDRAVIFGGENNQTPISITSTGILPIEDFVT